MNLEDYEISKENLEWGMSSTTYDGACEGHCAKSSILERLVNV